MGFPWALARSLPSAVRVRIKSRSTLARPPSTASIKRPVCNAIRFDYHRRAKFLSLTILRDPPPTLPI